MNGYPSFYLRIALVAPSPGEAADSNETAITKYMEPHVSTVALSFHYNYESFSGMWVKLTQARRSIMYYELQLV